MCSTLGVVDGNMGRLFWGRSKHSRFQTQMTQKTLGQHLHQLRYPYRKYNGRQSHCEILWHRKKGHSKPAQIEPQALEPDEWKNAARDLHWNMALAQIPTLLVGPPSGICSNSEEPTDIHIGIGSKTYTLSGLSWAGTLSPFSKESAINDIVFPKNCTKLECSVTRRHWPSGPWQSVWSWNDVPVQTLAAVS